MHQHAQQADDFSRAFAIGIALNTVYVVLEAGVGLSIGSLGLLADAGHNASDVFSLVVAWTGASLATRPPTERYTYGLYAWNGIPYLGRTTPGGTTQPVVGPLDARAASPLAFAFYDENGAVTADPLLVSQIEVTLRTSSDVRNPQGDLVADSLILRVNTRN